jgi:hypothetical protein
VFRIFGNAIHRADFHALRVFIPAYTLCTALPVNNENVVPLGNGLIGAFGFAHPAVDTIFVD